MKKLSYSLAATALLSTSIGTAATFNTKLSETDLIRNHAIISLNKLGQQRNAALASDMSDIITMIDAVAEKFVAIRSNPTKYNFIKIQPMLDELKQENIDPEIALRELEKYQINLEKANPKSLNKLWAQYKKPIGYGTKLLNRAVGAHSLEETLPFEILNHPRLGTKFQGEALPFERTELGYRRLSTDPTDFMIILPDIPMTPMTISDDTPYHRLSTDWHFPHNFTFSFSGELCPYFIQNLEEMRAIEPNTDINITVHNAS